MFKRPRKGIGGILSYRLQKEVGVVVLYKRCFCTNDALKGGKSDRCGVLIMRPISATIQNKFGFIEHLESHIKHLSTRADFHAPSACDVTCKCQTGAHNSTIQIYTI